MASQKSFTRKSNHRKVLLFGIALILAIAVGIAFYATNRQKNPSSAINDTKQGTNVIKQGGKSAPTDAGNADKAPTQYDGPSPDSNSTLSGVINYAAVANGTLAVRTTINQSISTGSCSLTLTRPADGKSVQKTASIAPGPSSATCQGFDVPTSELGSGSWTILIKVTSEDKTGSIAGEVTI